MGNDLFSVSARRSGIRYCAIILVAAALLARIECFPLRHDEQFYIPSGILFSVNGLYGEFGYNQPPNLPILLHGLFAAVDAQSYLLVGRTALWCVWLCALLLMVGIARLISDRLLATLCAIGLFATNPILLGATGMTVTNNFLPLPFAMAGVYGFLACLKAPGRSPGIPFLSGVAIAFAVGLKANYILLLPPFLLAACLSPTAMPTRERLLRMTLPFCLGIVLGLGPSLFYFLSDPDGFLAHVARYHRDAQTAYWAANSDVDGAKALTLGQKLQLALSLWTAGTAALIPLSLILLAPTVRSKGGPRWLDEAIILVASITLLMTAGCFVPTPAFPQYYAPPLPFAIVLILLLLARLDATGTPVSRPVLAGTMLYILLVGGPQLGGDLPGIARPSRWTGNVFHRQAQRLAALTGSDPRPIATLAPLYPLEAGRPIYPELAGGFVLFRVGDVLERREARHYRALASPGTVETILAQSPPSAILIGTEGELDLPFARFARSNGYLLHTPPILDQRKGPLLLFLPARSPVTPNSRLAAL